jgi:thioredoxin reductase (NADPH)
MPARSADHIRIEAYCGSRDRLRSLFELAEDSAAGVFAVGDVRHGSVKRVASAVGEGSVAIRLVHDYLALPGHVP